MRYVIACIGKYETRYLSEEANWVARPLAREFHSLVDATKMADPLRAIAPAPLEVQPAEEDEETKTENPFARALKAKGLKK